MQQSRNPILGTLHGATGIRVVPRAVPGSQAAPLLLDVDGTLVDSVYEHVLAWREALEEAEIRLPSWKIHRRIGISGNQFLPALLRELGQKISKAEVESIEKIRKALFAKKVPEIRILPGAKELLAFFGRMQVPWALATNGDRRQAEELLKGLAIPSDTPVITSDEVAARPAPDSFVLAAQRLGVSGRDSIVIGGSPWDMLAAQRMKALSVGLLCGGYAQCELEHAGAFRVYQDPGDLLDHIEELGLRAE